MIQPFFSSMITLMLAKFIINDMPHAAGLTNVQSSGRENIPSTFGTVDREQRALDFLLPYLRSEPDDIELDVEEFMLEAGKDYPYATLGEHQDGSVFIWIHRNPFPGEVADSLRVLAHEIGHYRTVGVAGWSRKDSEAQAKSVGKYLLRKWLAG